MDDPRKILPPPALPELLDRGDLARLFHVTRPTILAWERQGKLPGPLVAGLKPLWSAESIAALLGRG
jgi:hypothetical protein